MPKKITTKRFIEKANRVHNNLYDYSFVKYDNNKTEVCIICKIHGNFLQRPDVHLKGHGCAKCSRNAKKTTEEFIEEARIIHGDKYDYSKVEYINSRINVCIICKLHGEFFQRPDHHIIDKNKCPKCSNKGYSQISIKFLKVLAKELDVDIQHAENKGEYIINDPDFKCYYKADGYFEKDNKKYVVEFHGDYFHGNPKMYKPESICKLRRIRFDELYKKTMERMSRIKALGYEVIYIWEQDFMKYLDDAFALVEYYYVVL